MPNHKDKTIFLIEEDNDARPLLRATLKREGYHVTLAIDEDDARERVTHGQVKADLLLINLLRESPASILDTARDLLRRAQLEIPIVVIATDLAGELGDEIIEAGSNEYVAYIEDGDRLFELLSRLLGGRTAH